MKQEQERREKNPKSLHDPVLDWDPIEPGENLEAIAEKLYFVAEDAGDPELTMSDPATAHLHYPDGSTFTARFEMRPGELGALGPHPLNEDDAKTKNEQFSKNKKAKEEALDAARKDKEEKGKEDKEEGGGKKTPQLGAESRSQPQNKPQSHKEQS